MPAFKSAVRGCDLRERVLPGDDRPENGRIDQPGKCPEPRSVLAHQLTDNRGHTGPYSEHYQRLTLVMTTSASNTRGGPASPDLFYPWRGARLDMAIPHRLASAPRTA